MSPLPQCGLAPSLRLSRPAPLKGQPAASRVTDLKVNTARMGSVLGTISGGMVNDFEFGGFVSWTAAIFLFSLPSDCYGVVWPCPGA